MTTRELTTTVEVIAPDVLDAAVAEARIRNLRFPRTLDEQIAAALKPILASLDYAASPEQHGAMIDAGLAVLQPMPREEWSSLKFVLLVLAAAEPHFPTEWHNIEVTPDSIVTADAGSDASSDAVAELERLLADEQIVRARRLTKSLPWSRPEWASGLVDLAERIEARITEIQGGA